MRYRPHKADIFLFAESFPPCLSVCLYARLSTQISDNITARDTMFIMIISNIIPFYPMESRYN